MIRWSLLLLLILSDTGWGYVAGSPGRNPIFLSPQKRWEVVFRVVEHLQFTPEQTASSPDALNRVRYQIEFSPQTGQGPVRSIEYQDVYGADFSGKPTPLETLFVQMIWSPKEDFAVLPEEGWPSAPGTALLKALALSPGLGWTKADFHLDNFHWADSLRVVGDVHDDCEYSVRLFDGKTGKTEIIQSGASPEGFQIGRVEGRELMLQKVLDNCRREEDLSRFVAECFTLDLDSLSLKPVTCDMPTAPRR